jgi:hypothetical protein
MKKALLFAFLFAPVAAFSQPNSGDKIDPSSNTSLSVTKIKGTAETSRNKSLQNEGSWPTMEADESVNDVGIRNIADLRANNYHSTVAKAKSENDKLVIKVLGYYSANDGGGGDYYWDETCGLADDGAFYFKPRSVVGNGRWRPVFVDGIINLKRMGCKGDGAFDNRSMIQAVIDAIPGNTANSTTLVLKAGTEGRNFFCSGTINLHTVTLEGGSLYGTILSFPGATVGVKMIADAFGNYPCLKDIAIVANVKDPNDGYIGGARTKGLSNDPNDYHYHGIYVNAIARLDNVDVESFSGHGIRVYASVGDVPPTNASSFIIERCRVRNMRGAGIYISGPDANQGTVTAVDVRDNGLCGIWDASFLGNQFFACMGHNNGIGGTIGGHYRVTNLNARSTFIGCYGEGGSQPSYMGPYGTFIGGTNETAVNGSGSIWVNNKFNKIVVAKQGPTNEGYSINADVGTGRVYQRWTDSSGGSWATMWSLSPNRVSWAQNFNTNDLGSYVWQMGGVGAEFNVGVNGNTPRKRTLFAASHQFSPLMIGSKNFQTLTNTASGNLLPAAFQYGDVIYKGSAHENEIWSWRNISPGFSGNGVPVSYTEGVTATTDGTQYVKLSNRSSVLLPGIAIVLNGKTGIILDTMTIRGSEYIFTDITYPNNQTPAKITFPTPTWQAYGYSTGLDANKPNLTPTDYGYRYFSTDQNKWYTWNGTAWMGEGGQRTSGAYTPTSSKDRNGTVGDFSWDDNYIYIKTSAGWKRAALSTF